ncbi:MAG: hypothetical protein GC200_08740 [Tepidisphaera sp.]|nr:hypothetical protein [Tepidisphaera sp.]
MLRLCCVCGLVLAAFLPAGCSYVGGRGLPAVTSVGSGVTLTTALPTRLYTFEDQNTADFYLTDLPPETWTSGGDVSHATGVFMHLHMFIAPRAGRTPISAGATVIDARVIVLAGGAMGVYGGGGFLLRDGDAGDESFGGRVPQATMRLVRATPGFVDRLGPSTLDGVFDASLDVEQVTQVRRAFDTLIAATAPVAEAPSPGNPLIQTPGASQ